MLPVIIGFLLEYYSGGSLEQILRTSFVLRSLYKRRRAYIDIKPSSIVLDANENAILIDVSGTGGYVATDCWAYGRLLLALAEKSDTPRIDKKLYLIADSLTKAAPKSRISLCDTPTQLNEE
ncbi:uncharacterized protein N7500_005857 [Penicillium coprophilum]|uniref:uncharacterized protein n=1 Tax=Penicillium coprophilum TaxID=36646 RepID=UPI0023934B00|nr:uncharacterized protein N7500_005857 [Penicillium coprophilum]KAJ5164027.1 hypothetical protein N7500_005857 [Penicillium coprophilum]